MTKRQKKKIYKFIYALIILIVVTILNHFELLKEDENLVEPTISQEQLVTLDSCVDGDTAKFNINGEIKKVRFLAIDTPETVHPYKSEEEYGKNASEYTCKKLKEANNIKLEYETNLYKFDKYDRLLAWVFVDDNLLQEELVKIGYAKVRYIYAKYTYLDKLLETQKIAKQEKNGLWYDYEEENYDTNKTYKITFKYNNEEKEITVNEGSSINLIDNPTKDNYLFAGWKNNGNLFDTNEPVTKDITLNASFKKE